MPVHGKAIVGIVSNAIGDYHFDSVARSGFYCWTWKLACLPISNPFSHYCTESRESYR